jgi:hypothetical protein
MKMTERLKFVRQRVKDQREWIDRHGGDLAGYIRYYGDPGIAPCDKNGNAETITCPDDLARECGLRPVPDAPGCYYKEHFGSGGTLIFQADIDCLLRYERELVELEPRYGRYLDDEQAEKTPQCFSGMTRDLTAERLLSDIEAALYNEFKQAEGAVQNARDPSTVQMRAKSLSIEPLRRIYNRLRLGRRCLGLATPSMKGDPAMVDRPWS